MTEMDRLYAALAEIPKPDGTIPPPLTADERAKAARRLSGALGRKVDPDDIDVVAGEFVVLKNGQGFTLYAGNVCRAGGGRWMKNGQEWEDAWTTETTTPRPLAQ